METRMNGSRYMKQKCHVMVNKITDHYSFS